MKRRLARGCARTARRLARGLLALLGVAAAALVVLAGTALFALRAAPGDWSVRAGIGPFAMPLSVPALLRVAAHPLGIRLIAGRSVHTRFGTLRASAGSRPASLRLRCAPCVVDVAAVAAVPLHLEWIEVDVDPGEPNTWRGEVRAAQVRAQWKARLTASGAELSLQVPDMPVADLAALFGAAVPEAARARIEGRAGGSVRLALPSGRYAVEPRLEGLFVAGLGTEALIAATPAPACARPLRRARSATPFGPWLAKAVLAAEDQRFHEHPGYDLAEMAAAWSNDGPSAPERRRGASTLSQQLVKLLYTGEERSAARKLRELLYAAELDRTLGKARVLQLYLSIAPWGDGQCGAQAAALHYFGRPAAALEAAEAVWLASLLRHPQAELERAARRADADPRWAVIAGGLRPLARWRRNEVQAEMPAFVPPPVVLRRAALP